MHGVLFLDAAGGVDLAILSHITVRAVRALFLDGGVGVWVISSHVTVCIVHAVLLFGVGRGDLMGVLSLLFRLYSFLMLVVEILRVAVCVVHAVLLLDAGRMDCCLCCECCTAFLCWWS